MQNTYKRHFDVQGEVEVTKMQGNERRRLGFLAEGAFFGESPVTISEEACL